MPAKSSRTRQVKRAEPAAADVEAFLAALEHPLKREILAVRAIILAADRSISEGIKWNAPSFRTSTDFATFHLRAKDGVQVILHFGAKVRAITGIDLEDPESLVQWLAKDRASVVFRDLKEVAAKRIAFTKVIRQWLAHL